MICNISEKSYKSKYIKVKRVLDAVISLIAIIVLLPVFIIVSLAIKIDSRGPILFKQTRIGIDHKYFSLYKFRTMTIDTPKYCPTNMFNDSDKYITRVGRFLRKTSIDELPQLINVLKGEMSIIGPRPLIPSEVNVHILRDSEDVYSVLPGITGLAQINGRDNIDIVTKVKYDSDYVRNISFKTDIEILFKTVIKVLKREDIREGTCKDKVNVVIIDKNTHELEGQENMNIGENACV